MSTRIERVDVSVYRIPTDAPESDGTLAWDHTTLVVAEPSAGGTKGIGYTYADAATGKVIEETLAPAVVGLDAGAPEAAFWEMVRKVRNLGYRGIAAMAVSAVDASLWDLAAKLAGVPLYQLLGAARDGVPAYGSGGFTSYTLERIREQLGGWAASGMTMVKMKIGRDPAADPTRVRAAREAIGEGVELFVDANGAFTPKQAMAMAETLCELGVTWFEEPVSSDDLAGLRRVRDRSPAGMDVAAGEYGYHAAYFRSMLDAGAVDVLQADATRCGGISGFAAVAGLCRAAGVPLSAHCAPSQHAHPASAFAEVRHVEYFHDHARVEEMVFDGAASPRGGIIRPDPGRPGMGIELKRRDAEKWRV